MILVPATNPKNWQNLLADPKKHWKKHYSARTLAHCWQDANGFPTEVKILLSTSPVDQLTEIEMLFGIPEHQVFIPPIQGHPSQNDLFILGKAKDGSLVTIMVEGKVSESFDVTLGEWKQRLTRGKQIRLKFLLTTLGLSSQIPDDIRYQLLHRLSSAIVEADKFRAKYAVLLVHSFSQQDEWFDDYSAFLDLYCVKAKVGTLSQLGVINGIEVFAGWVRGNKRFLSA